MSLTPQEVIGTRECCGSPEDNGRVACVTFLKEKVAAGICASTVVWLFCEDVGLVRPVIRGEVLASQRRSGSSTEFLVDTGADLHSP